jgi:hypothetical protein
VECEREVLEHSEEIQSKLNEVAVGIVMSDFLDNLSYHVYSFVFVTGTHKSMHSDHNFFV